MTTEMRIPLIILVFCQIIIPSFTFKALSTRYNVYPDYVHNGQSQKLYMSKHTEAIPETVFKALNHFKKVYSHMDIPLNFVVPKNTSWPVNLHGYGLGTVIRKVKYQGALSDHHAQLESIGFRVSTHNHKFNIFMTALKLFKKLEDSTVVPRTFVVPHTAPWPEECWGCKLGAKVCSTRASKLFTIIFVHLQLS
jgi:hypothetical protein